MILEDYIANHTSKNYCEVVISPNGDIEDAIPSHLYKLISVSGESMDNLNKMISRRAAPMEWLIEHTGYAVCWYNYFIVPDKYTDNQRRSITELIKAGVMSTCRGHTSVEKSLCAKLDEFDKNCDSDILDYLPSKRELSWQDL